MRIAILPTWTMDVIYIRALTPTFSWGKPHNGDLSITWLANKTLSYVLPRATLESCSSLRLRASSRVHSQCTQPSSFITGSVQSWLRPVITHPRHTKNHAVWNCKIERTVSFCIYRRKRDILSTHTNLDGLSFVNSLKFTKLEKCKMKLFLT